MSSPKSGKTGRRNVLETKQFGSNKVRLKPKIRQREVKKLVVAKVSLNDVGPPDDGSSTGGSNSESQQTSVIVTKRRPEKKNNSFAQLSFDFSHIMMTSKRPRGFA